MPGLPLPLRLGLCPKTRKCVIFTIMKKTLFVFLFVLFFTACGSDSSTSANNSNDDDISSKSSSSSAKSSSSIVAKSSSSQKTVSSSSDKVAELVDSADVIVGSMKDSRDGQKYKMVKIGEQTWMAENLNYETANSYCYNDDAANCTKYGRLYTWVAATTACPEGWHLPTQTEWSTLFTAVGGQSVAGTKFKSTSGWNSSGNGTDAFSFSALPAGSRDNDGDYYDEGDYADFWSSTEDSSDYAYSMDLGYDDGGAYLNYNYKYFGFSVRCLQD